MKLRTTRSERVSLDFTVNKKWILHRNQTQIRWFKISITCKISNFKLLTHHEKYDKNNSIFNNSNLGMDRNVTNEALVCNVFAMCSTIFNRVETHAENSSEKDRTARRILYTNPYTNTARQMLVKRAEKSFLRNELFPMSFQYEKCALCLSTQNLRRK